MPILLIPFIILAAGNTHMHKRQADAEEARVAIEQKQYELNLRQYNEAHPVTVKRGITVYHKKPA
jgi:hypothetical protein